jgi:hypothetical protein
VGGLGLAGVGRSLERTCVVSAGVHLYVPFLG